MEKGKRIWLGMIVLLGASGCAASDSGPSKGDCNISLSYEGHRYEVHTGLANPPVGQPLGIADEMGCESDPTVYGTEKIATVEGVSKEVAVAVVNSQRGSGRVTVYLRDDQPRDRAPASWPVSLPPDNFK
ncbi:hypothetical protein [Nocardioides sp.]|uniref:hypothetical protein n=1 Tax=Nocardioides sp. TaxID=35761 RepID=UPI002616708E|nr:hypothetical protein [Nocardioides sp.]